MYTNFNQNDFMTWMENEFNLNNYSIQIILYLIHYINPNIINIQKYPDYDQCFWLTLKLG